MDALEPTVRQSTGTCPWQKIAIWCMLLAMPIIPVGLGASRVLSSRAWQHHAAVARIERYWGSVFYLEEPPREPQPWWRKLLGNSFFGNANCVRGAPTRHCRLEDVIGLPELQQLELTGTQLDAAGLGHLKTLHHLWILSLDGTNVTDADLQQIEGLTNLEWLNLSRTQITDKGLEHLKPLHHLTLLHLNSTHVTDGGVKMLRAALPNCDIDR